MSYPLGIARQLAHIVYRLYGKKALTNGMRVVLFEFNSLTHGADAEIQMW